MNPRVLRRFVIIMAIATFVTFAATVAYKYVAPPPGDYEVRKGDILLSDKKYPESIEWFDKALERTPNHRGALMGRAAAFIQLEQYPEAVAELDYLIAFLNKTLEPDDGTGLGVLAAAYANRGIVNDRQGKYERALADYIKSLRTDEDTVSGPDFIYKILYDPRPSNVRKRAQYIYEQLKLPEGQRLMRVPELDAEQRMYKP